jgi:hypothetical protein
MCGFPACENEAVTEAGMCGYHRRVKVAEAWPGHGHAEANDD